MPYRSIAQQRFMHAAAARGDIKPSVVKEFDEATKKKKGGFRSLPERKSDGGEVHKYANEIRKKARGY